MAMSGEITTKMQAWVYFLTWVQYAANHLTRKCYTNVKNIMIAKGLSKMVLGRMDAGFMFTYAFGAPLAGQLGDIYKDKNHLKSMILLPLILLYRGLRQKERTYS